MSVLTLKRERGVVSAQVVPIGRRSTSGQHKWKFVYGIYLQPQYAWRNPDQRGWAVETVVSTECPRA